MAFKYQVYTIQFVLCSHMRKRKKKSKRVETTINHKMVDQATMLSLKRNRIHSLILKRLLNETRLLILCYIRSYFLNNYFNIMYFIFIF